MPGWCEAGPGTCCGEALCFDTSQTELASWCRMFRSEECCDSSRAWPVHGPGPWAPLP